MISLLLRMLLDMSRGSQQLLRSPPKLSRISNNSAAVFWLLGRSFTLSSSVPRQLMITKHIFLTTSY